jgi:hypothetical protein
VPTASPIVDRELVPSGRHKPRRSTSTNSTAPFKGASDARARGAPAWARWSVGVDGTFESSTFGNVFLAEARPPSSSTCSRMRSTPRVSFDSPIARVCNTRGTPRSHSSTACGRRVRVTRCRRRSTSGSPGARSRHRSSGRSTCTICRSPASRPRHRSTSGFSRWSKSKGGRPGFATSCRAQAERVARGGPPASPPASERAPGRTLRGPGLHVRLDLQQHRQSAIRPELSGLLP